MKLRDHIALQQLRVRIERGGRKHREWLKLRRLVWRGLKADVRRSKKAGA